MKLIHKFANAKEAKKFVEDLEKAPTEIKGGKFDGAILHTAKHFKENILKYRNRKDLFIVLAAMGPTDKYRECIGIMIHNGKVVSNNVMSLPGNTDMNKLMTVEEKEAYLAELDSRFNQIKDSCKRLDKVIKRLAAENNWISNECQAIDFALRLSEGCF